jgi:hypothetical protein
MTRRWRFVRSFVRSAPPLCPNTDSVQLHSIDSLENCSLARSRMVAVFLAAYRRRRSNDTSLLELGFGRSHARLFADTDFIVTRM